MKKILYIFILSTFLFSSSIDELIDYGLKHSGIIKKSKNQIELSKLQHQNSKVMRYGDLNIVGNYTRYNSPRTLAPLTPSVIASGKPITTSENIFTSGVSYSVALFTGFAQTKQIEIDSISQNISYIKSQLTMEQFAYNIRSLYLSILAQQEILKAQKSYTNALRKLTNQIKIEVNLGKKAQIDLFKAESNLQSSKTYQEIISSNIEITKSSLSALVGKKVTRLRALKFKIKKPRYSINKLYKKIEKLSKIKIENMGIKKANHTIDKTNSAKLPQVHLNSYIGKNYAQDLISDDWDDETLWQVEVNVKYNLIDFGKSNIASQKAKIAKMNAIYQKEQSVLDMKKSLNEAVEKIKQSYAQYLGNNTQLKLMSKSQKIEQVRYNNSVATLNDLLFIKGQRALAQAKVIESRYNYKKSIYYLDYLLERGIK